MNLRGRWRLAYVSLVSLVMATTLAVFASCTRSEGSLCAQGYGSEPLALFDGPTAVLEYRRDVAMGSPESIHEHVAAGRAFFVEPGTRVYLMDVDPFDHTVFVRVADGEHAGRTAFVWSLVTLGGAP